MRDLVAASILLTLLLAASCVDTPPSPTAPPLHPEVALPSVTPDTLRAEQAMLREEIDRLSRRWKASMALENALRGARPAEEVARRSKEYEAAR